MYFSVFTYLKVGQKDFEAQNRYYFNVSFSKLTKNILTSRILVSKKCQTDVLEFSIVLIFLKERDT